MTERRDEASAGVLIAQAVRVATSSPLFTLNGGHIWPLYFGAQEQGIPIYDVRHEQTAGFAAEGWAKLKRECGVAAVTAGPGVTNSVSAVATARGNDSPVLLLGGRSPAGRWGQGSLQEMDHLPVLASLTKCARTLASPEEAYEAAAEAMRLALSQRTGPAFLDAPLDVLFANADRPEATEHLVADPGPPPDPEQVDAVARLIREAHRPVVFAGGTVWWAGAETALVRLVEAARLPLYMNGLARGILPPAHELYRSRSRSKAFAEADLLLIVGVPLDFRAGFGESFAPDARIVYLDVDDFRKHRPPAAAVYGDLRRALEMLAGRVEGLPRRREWLEALAADERARREKDRALREASSSPVHPARLVHEVEAFCDRDAILIGDGGDFISFAGRFIERDRPGLWMDAGPFGCLGAGPGYALAAKVAHPDRQVVLLCGDGAFGFGAMEFDTYVRHRVPIVCVIGNNGIWALEKHPMQGLFGKSIAADLRPGVRYDKVVEALGGHGELVRRPDDIRPALERAFKAGAPACINVMIDAKAEYPRSAVLT
jgi:acetolactate synthase-1/2/3 large subunit